MNKNNPSFSVIIPTYSRTKQLARCLYAVSNLNYSPGAYEVIVVDDGSTLPVGPILEPYYQKLDLTLLSQSNAGPASARNNGAAHAKGKYLAFTDDDCTPDPNWLLFIARRFEKTPDHAIGGHTENILLNNLFSSTSQLLVDYLYDYFFNRGASQRFLTSNNLAVPKARFKELGGFDERMTLAAGEDREFCDRWLHHGYDIAYAPEAIVYHSHEHTFASFCRQHFNYGRGASFYHRARQKRRKDITPVEPSFFYINLFMYSLKVTRGNRAFLFIALLFVTQLANTYGFLWQRFVERKQEK